jgi:hypothetical protein
MKHEELQLKNQKVQLKKKQDLEVQTCKGQTSKQKKIRKKGKKDNCTNWTEQGGGGRDGTTHRDSSGGTALQP